jgi:hypothetical protein
MNELIQALTIFLKYRNLDYPTICEHDVLIIAGVPKALSEEDSNAVTDLGFYWSDNYDSWVSTKFGSA